MYILYIYNNANLHIQKPSFPKGTTWTGQLKDSGLPGTARAELQRAWRGKAGFTF
jgi:hypothetical protein